MFLDTYHTSHLNSNNLVVIDDFQLQFFIGQSLLANSYTP